MILYFIAGIVEDFLFTLSIRFVARGQALWASTCAFLQTIILVGVIYNILKQLDSQRSIVAIIIYALGIGTGTLLTMKFKLGARENK